MSRGFVAIWYDNYRNSYTGGTPGARDRWAKMILGTLQSWRFHHPGDRLMFLDLDSQFSEEQWAGLGRIGIEDGRRWYPFELARAGRSPAGWTRTFLDKAIALEFSPFDETCLFDLDFLFLAPVSRVFDLVGQVGLLSYPGYRLTRNKVNAGLWVVRDRSIWPAFWRAAEAVRGVSPDNDEPVLDLCVDRGDFQVTKLSATYGMDPFCWLAMDGVRRKGRGWYDVAPLQPPPGRIGAWMMGDKVIRAIHLSGARDRIVGSPLWEEYQAALWLALFERYRQK